MKFKYKKSFLLFLSILLGWANYCLALEVQTYPSLLGFTISQNSSPTEYAKYFFNAGIAIAGILAVLVIIFGGIYYLISFGRGKYTNEGKNWIKSGIIGLLILVSAYLMVYTINPDLVVFRLEKLFPVNFSGFLTPPNNQTNTPEGDYQEIPIGIMAENLLSGTIDCYDFDGNGDPIDGSQIRADDGRNILGPTYLEHDRVDCFLKLSQAAEKKAQTIKNLSDEITKLMNQCACGDSFPSAGSGTGSQKIYTPGGVVCQNAICSKGALDSNGQAADCKYSTPAKCPIDTNCVGSTKPCKDTCSNKGCSGSGNCCPADAKQKMEHGPITMVDCNNQGKNYLGLDEFRSQFSGNYSAIKQKVEIQPAPKLNNKEISVIKTGNCQTCSSTDSKCLDNRKKCLKQSPWYNLRLVDQLTYLQGKINEIKQKVKDDLDNLSKGRNALAQCSAKDMEKSSVDILHLQEETKKEDKTINITKNFTDPGTGQAINSSKYCSGFNYANSNCFQQCQNMCPDTSQQAIACYGQCDKCQPGDSNCLNKQEKCVENCFNSKPCIFGDSNNFGGCIQSCRQQCSDNCSKNYSCTSSAELTQCQNSCNGDSKCVLDNKDKCLINSQFFQQCGNLYKNLDCTSQNNNGDCGNLKSCMDNSYLCKYGSDQNAGYPDCVSFNKPKDNYSSSFLYQNPTYQQCQNPYRQDNSVTCLDVYPNTTKCPASSQCPLCPCETLSETINYATAPTLPQAPVDACSVGGSTTSSSGSSACQTTDPLRPGYCAGGGVCIGGVCVQGSSNGGVSSSGGSKTINQYRVVTGQCSNFNYSIDPLTFYCRVAWEPQAPISGKWMQCQPENEIPVGQTVDDAEKWGQNFMDNIDKFTQKAQEMLQYVNKIGKDPEQNHCQCGSKCEGGDPTCQAKCTFQQTKKITTPAAPIQTNTINLPSSFNQNNGNVYKVLGDTTMGGSITLPPIDYTPGGGSGGTDTPSGGGSTSTTSTKWTCSCVRQGCSGNPCQKMINWMQGKSANQDCSVGIADPGIAYYVWQMDNTIKDFIISGSAVGRSDILKELSYSRKKMDECSQQSTGLGGDVIETFSCTKAYLHTTCLTKRCYGILDGQVQNKTETDNWFCAKTLLK